MPDKEALSEATEEELLQATVILARLGNFLMDTGQLAQAETVLRTSLMYITQIEDAIELRFVYSRLVLLSIKRGEWERAQQFVNFTRQINEEPIPPLTPATQYMNDAVIAYHQGRFETAKEAIMISIDYFKQANAVWGEGHARRWFGVIQYQLGHYAASSHQLSLSCQIHAQLQDRLGHALAKCQIGQIALRNEDIDHALVSLNEAHKQAKHIGHETLLTMVETELAAVYLQQKNYRQTQIYLDTALECALKLEQPPLLLNVLSILIKFAITKGVITDCVRRVSGAIVTHPNGSYIMQASMRDWLNRHYIYLLEKNTIYKLMLEDIHSISKQIFVKD